MEWISEFQQPLTEEESMHNAQMVVNHFVGSDWSRESLSAMIGNMRHESYINPDMYEFNYSWEEDRGYGLVQWTPRSKYWDWAVANGLPPRDGDSQLARIDYEVDNNIQWIPRSDYGNMTFEQFRTNSGNWSVEYLTEAFTWGYERPNTENGWESMPDRKAFANRAYNELDWAGTGECTNPSHPVDASAIITSPYGWRTHPVTGEQDFHAGTDWASSESNPPIYAVQSGQVLLNQFSDTAGWWVIIKHTGDPYYSRYLHLATQAHVNVGDSVTSGQDIGIMGTTGTSTGVHLHLEIAISQDGFGTEEGTIDPEEYLLMEFCGPDPEPTPENESKRVVELLLCDCLNGWKY